MPLTVLQVAFPFAPVGIDRVGGAEQILSACDAAVVRAGHRSIVVACEGSQAAGELVTVPRVVRADHAAARAEAHAAHRRAIDAAIARFGVDVVHCHGIDFASYLPAEGPSMLVTLHLARSIYDEDALAPGRPGTFFNCVSRTQHAHYQDIANLLPPVPNGVDIERLRPDPSAQRKHALLLARVCREKGIHLAIEAAKQADIDLIIAGEIFPYADHERYFDEEVRPHLDVRRTFVGPVGFEEKRRLLQSALCLLLPTLAEETSSLVAMEALACGAPVIAFRRGALAEVVEDGVAGALVDDADEMAAAIARTETFDKDACLASARQKFNAERVTGEYIGMYEKLAARSWVNQYAEAVAS